MKGDQDRGEDLFRSISQGKKFKKDIIEIREKFLISTGGFSDMSYIYDWDSRQSFKFFTNPEESDFRKKINWLLSRHGMPLNHWWRNRIITHVVSGDKIDYLPKPHDFQRPFVELVNRHVDLDGSYNDIRIYGKVTQDDIRDFAGKAWKHVRPSYQVGTTKKIRRQNPKDIEINKEAVFFMDMSKQKLGIKKGTTKEIEIGKFLSKKHKKRITPDAVKSRANRTKNKKG